nr:hypothetical protein [Halomonas ventosae]
MLSAASQAHGYLVIDADTAVEEGHVYGYCPGAPFLDRAAVAAPPAA